MEEIGDEQLSCGPSFEMRYLEPLRHLNGVTTVPQAIAQLDVLDAGLVVSLVESTDGMKDGLLNRATRDQKVAM